jgi:3-oxoadipate enol-lactonase
MPTAKVNGIEMYYDTKGEGYPLLMLQGFGASSETWDTLVPRVADLSKYYTTITPDNRGTGRSSLGEGKFTVRTMADDSVALLDELGIKKAHVLGTSFGGMISQEIAINYPERVKGLVLLYTGPGGSTFDYHGQRSAIEKMGWLSSPPPEMTLEAVMDEVLGICYYGKWLELNKSKILASPSKYPTPTITFTRQYEALLGFDTTSRLSRIKSSTLVVHGENDLAIFPEAARFMASRIWGSELRMLKEAGHCLSEERWGDVREMVLEFLSRIDKEN